MRKLHLLTCLISATFAANLLSAADTSTTRPRAENVTLSNPTPQKKETKPEEVTWGNEGAAELRIPLTGGDQLTSGPPSSNYVLVGAQLWDLSTGKPIGKRASIAPQRGSVRALSADGEWLALALPESTGSGGAINVFSLQTDRSLFKIPIAKEQRISKLAFAGRSLLVMDMSDRGVDVWDVSSATKAKTLNTGMISLNALTDDGKYFAFIHTQEEVWVDDVRAGTRVAIMNQPPVRDVEIPGRNPADPPTKISAKDPRAAMQHFTTMANAHGLAFSPNAKELAMFTSYPVPRLVVWSNQGAVSADIDVPISRSAIYSGDGSVVWLPDGSGWLLNGAYVVNRKAKCVVWSRSVPFGAAENTAHFVGLDKFTAVMFNSSGQTLETRQIPFDKINQSLEVMNSRAPVFLRPGDAITLKFDLGTVHGDPAETQKDLTEALTQRIMQNGLKVGENAAHTLLVSWRETTGQDIKIVEKQNAFDFRGHDTGRTAKDAQGAMTLELHLAGHEAAIWSAELEGRAGRSFTQEITDATMRQSMVENIRAAVQELNLPYFIPGDLERVTLPVDDRPAP